MNVSASKNFIAAQDDSWCYKLRQNMVIINLITLRNL